MLNSDCETSSLSTDESKNDFKHSKYQNCNRSCNCKKKLKTQSQRSLLLTGNQYAFSQQKAA